MLWSCETFFGFLVILKFKAAAAGVLRFLKIFKFGNASPNKTAGAAADTS